MPDKMNYPTMEEVEAADRIQLCRWHRFLPSPGSRAIDRSSFLDVLNAESRAMNRICQRIEDLGGFTSEISKLIGWGEAKVPAC
ncbi:hypothetical protein JW777_00730 [bacterium]|nr:hypothetical protein [bacterium]